ncbi:MAG: CooT family nickel-binding protein [Firmicutes bacterium]|nr:CooT family nickel-binding protein [Bacillota bacterium]
MAALSCCGVTLKSVFGEQKRIRARLKETRLLEHKIFLERI